LKNEKKVLKESDVKQIIVPKYDELSVKNLQLQVFDDPLVKDYFPDMNDNKRTIDRTFFYNVLNTVYPEYLSKLVDHALEVRNKPEDDETKKEYILMSDEWYDQLMSHPFISSMITIHNTQL
jgi:hypothetical protein